MAMQDLPSNVPVAPLDGHEFVCHEGRPYALIIHGGMQPEATTFLTDDEHLLQVGFIVRKGGEPILPHLHLEAIRKVNETWEFLWVRQGSTTVTLYSSDRQPIAQRLLRQGDAILLMGGGHGFEVHEDLVLLEIKQGPFVGTLDKERF
jgi:hypothetical protein